jgi:hypothetical protein
VGLGQGALVFNSTGSSSTGIGFGAGFNTTGSNNVYLGYRSGYSVTSGANNVIIGSYEGSTAPISATNSNWIVLSDGAGNVRQAIDSAGNSQFLAGAVVVYAPEPESISGSATLTNANLQKQIILGTGAANFTLPLGTTLETLVTWAGVNLGFNFSILSLSPGGSINVIGNTGTTYVGAQTISVGVSASFRIRRTAANTFVVYRIS